MIEAPLGINTQCCMIGGQWVAPISNDYITLTNPSDGSAICEIARGGDKDIDRAVQSAQRKNSGDRHFKTLVSFLKGLSL